MASINPVSISALLSTGRTEAQPARLALAGAMSWADSALSPATKVENTFSRARPIFYSFIIPRTYLNSIGTLRALNILIQTRRQTVGGSSFLRMALMPFAFRYSNINISNQLDTTTKVCGINPNSVSNMVSNVETYWEYANSPVAIDHNSEIQMSFDVDLDGFTNGYPLTAATGTSVRSPKSMELIRNLLSQDNKDPIITIMVFPSNSDTYFAVENKSGSYLNTLVIEFQGPSLSLTNNQFQGQQFSPVAAVKEKALGDYSYSLGLGLPYSHLNPNASGLQDLVAANTIGQYLISSAHVGSEAIYAEDEPLNRIYNGHFELPTRSCTYTTFNNATVNQPNCPAGWEIYSGKTISTNVTFTQSTLSKGLLPFKTPNEKSIKYLDVTMNDVIITPWTLTLLGTGTDITPSYQQYSTMAQVMGNQLEYNEEYLLEAWVKPYSGNSSKSKIRMSYVAAWADTPTGTDGGFAQFHTGISGAECSSDATINGNWQRLWIKIKSRHTNAFGMTRYLYQKASTENFVKAGDPNWNNLFPIAPPDKQCDIKQTAGIVRFDHVPISNASTDKQQIQFQLCNVTLTKLNNRDTGNNALSISEYDSKVWDKPVSSTKWWDDEPADWILPLRHAQASGSLPSVAYTLKSAHENVSVSPTYNTGIEIADWYGDSNLGFRGGKNKAETLLKFWTQKNNSIAEFGRGSCLAYQSPGGCSFVNPNEGSIEFWYCPHAFSCIVDGLYVTNQGLPQPRPSANYYDPAYGYCYRNHIIYNAGDAVDTNPAYNVGNIVYHSTLKNILTIGRFDTYGSIFVGPGISFCRKQRNLSVLVYRNESEQTLHTNADFMSTPNRLKFARLEYLIPDSLFRAVTHINNPTPVWFRIKFTWGVRQELYVNGELVDYNNIKGLFDAPSSIDTSNEILTNNVNMDTIWLGTIGSPKPVASPVRPIVYSDNFIMSDLMIYGKSRHQTRIPAMASGSAPNTWLNLETLNEISNGTFTSIANASGISYTNSDPGIGAP